MKKIRKIIRRFDGESVDLRYDLLSTNPPLTLFFFMLLLLFVFFFSLPQDVILQKGAGPLGLSIVGGNDHSCVPFGADDPGVFISKV